jgi:Tol biopolymer transport system component/DNA-binding winged helix-turn-helix (wHTH) protein
MACKSFVFFFEDIEVREREFAFVKLGEVFPVEPKAFRVLLVLLRNYQKLIPREELLNAVWGDAAVTENSLTRSIALLRRLLGDEWRNPRYIETVATVGYRFLCKVEVSEEISEDLSANDKLIVCCGDSDQTTIEGDDRKIVVIDAHSEAPYAEGAGGEANRERHEGVSRFLQNWWLIPGNIALLVGMAAAAWYLYRPSLPRISQYTQITHDGRQKHLSGSDGSRLYFEQSSPISLAEVAIADGDIAQIPLAVPDVVDLWDVSPDGSTLLVSANEEKNPSKILWSVAILGGSARRLGEAKDAAFSPDGKLIAYSAPNGDLIVAQSNGTWVRKLTSGAGGAADIAWSPDGGSIRFTIENVYFEISSDGTNFHRLMPEWQDRTRQCCGRWTSDGKFFLFLTVHSLWQGGEIWALDERRGPMGHPAALPFQLTTGPIHWSELIPGKDGKQIFASGETPRGELSRFDSRSKGFRPFLGGISAQFVSFSRDGLQVAYVSYPEGILWKANRDGSDPVRLSDPPVEAFLPRWSPDGAYILFVNVLSPNHPEICVVPSQGGTPRRLLPEFQAPHGDGDWSADGKQIVFSSPGSWARNSVLHLFDLTTRRVSTLPGSTGLFSPRWSPDGRYIAALSSLDSRSLSIFDTRTQQWVTLFRQFESRFPEWSRDSKFIYFAHYDGGEQGLFRVPVTGGKPEQIVDLKEWRTAGWFDFWMGLDPTDTPMILRDVGSNDIYALSLNEK